MYSMIKWTEDLDLTDFYKNAAERGFKNNSSQQMLVDCFRKEREWSTWILYKDIIPIGSVAAHSFDEIMGDNSYRICARTCVFTDMISGIYGKALRTAKVITHNQNPTAQFLMPTCIEWTPKNSNLYLTSNKSEIGTQKKVHYVFCPLMEKIGILKRVKNIYYRGTNQTIWKLNRDKFYEVLNRYPRWN
jgi:hypothetical protein